jgi:hypothetical protein
MHPRVTRVPADVREEKGPELTHAQTLSDPATADSGYKPTPGFEPGTHSLRMMAELKGATMGDHRRPPR